MKPEKKMDTFAVILLVALSQANLWHLLWTVWLTAEQIKTGWGGGTGIEMLALVPWLTEMASVPVFLTGMVYLVMSFFRKQNKGLLVANVALFICMVAQAALTNLFMFF